MASLIPRITAILDPDVVGSDAGFLARVRELAPAAAEGRVRVILRLKGVTPERRARLLDAIGAPMPGVALGGPADEARVRGYAELHGAEAEIDGLGREALVSVTASVHGAGAVASAVRRGLDAVMFGPVFTPRCKPGHARGLAVLRGICAVSPLPVIAVGGLDPAAAPSLKAAGVHGVAVLTPFCVDDPTQVLRQWEEALSH